MSFVSDQCLHYVSDKCWYNIHQLSILCKVQVTVLDHAQAAWCDLPLWLQHLSQSVAACLFQLDCRKTLPGLLKPKALSNLAKSFWNKITFVTKAGVFDKAIQFLWTSGWYIGVKIAMEYICVLSRLTSFLRCQSLTSLPCTQRQICMHWHAHTQYTPLCTSEFFVYITQL